MGTIVLISVAVISSIAFCCSVLIWGTGRIIHDEESHIEDIMAVLPGTNCAMCGYAGCRQFAVQLDARKESGGKLTCLAGGKKVAHKLALLLEDPSLEIMPTAEERKLKIEQFKASKKKNSA